MVSATLPFATNRNGQSASTMKVIADVRREVPACRLLLGSAVFRNSLAWRRGEPRMSLWFVLIPRAWVAAPH